MLLLLWHVPEIRRPWHQLRCGLVAIRLAKPAERRSRWSCWRHALADVPGRAAQVGPQPLRPGPRRRGARRPTRRRRGPRRVRHPTARHGVELRAGHAVGSLQCLGHWRVVEHLAHYAVRRGPLAVSRSAAHGAVAGIEGDVELSSWRAPRRWRRGWRQRRRALSRGRHRWRRRWQRRLLPRVRRRRRARVRTDRDLDVVHVSRAARSACWRAE
mmetsp:Transcript_32821/g.97707  ORF Transcript_32821/g.97707 Transcript_32821/m.97707 type:complete len:214 (+) Transcript_32821:159-800(+)